MPGNCEVMETPSPGARRLAPGLGVSVIVTEKLPLLLLSALRVKAIRFVGADQAVAVGVD
jgi:hypothetical protein